MDIKLILTILLTLVPFIELRGSIPLAVILTRTDPTNLWISLIIIVLLNVILTLFLYLFLNFLHKTLLNFKWYENFFDNFVLPKIRQKAYNLEMKIKNLGYVSLMLFVAIPFPGTGVYTGTLIAWFLGLNKKKAMLAIALGTIIAGILVTLISLGIVSFFD